jgi:hypothetical protein
MPVAVTFILLLLWLALAYRVFQRGDYLLAGIFLLVGISLTVYRIRRTRKRSEGTTSPGPNDPLK